MISRAKTYSACGHMFGCPKCGGHTYDQILNQRRRARDKRELKLTLLRGES